MKKGEFVDKLAAKTKLTKKDSKAALDATLELIMGCCARRDKITFPGFGTFRTTRRAATRKINPQTKRMMSVPAKTVPAFRAGKTFKQKVAR